MTRSLCDLSQSIYFTLTLLKLFMNLYKNTSVSINLICLPWIFQRGSDTLCKIHNIFWFISCANDMSLLLFSVREHKLPSSLSLYSIIADLWINPHLAIKQFTVFSSLKVTSSHIDFIYSGTSLLVSLPYFSTTNRQGQNDNVESSFLYYVCVCVTILHVTL